MEELGFLVVSADVLRVKFNVVRITDSCILNSEDSSGDHLVPPQLSD